MKTWVVEAIFVAIVLAAVALLTGGKPVEWLGAAAVLATFLHCQVGFRLSEAEDRRAQLKREAQALSQRYEHAADPPPLAAVQAADARYLVHVECHRWLQRYHVGKEILWCTYFSWLGAWSALVGVGVFMLYPAWRHIHVSRRKMRAAT